MDFAAMKRRELQALCKRHGLSAGGTNVDLVARLTATLSVSGGAVEEPVGVVVGKGCLKRSAGGASGVDSDAAKKVTFELEEDEEAEVVVAGRGRRRSHVMSSPAAAKTRGRQKAGEAPPGAKGNGGDRRRTRSQAGAGSADESDSGESGADATVKRSVTRKNSAKAEQEEVGLGEAAGRKHQLKRKTRENDIEDVDASRKVGDSRRSTRSSGLLLEPVVLLSPLEKKRGRRKAADVKEKTCAEEQPTEALHSGRTLRSGVVVVAPVPPIISESKKSKRKVQEEEPDVEKLAKVEISCRTTRSSAIGAPLTSPSVTSKKRGRKTDDVHLDGGPDMKMENKRQSSRLTTRSSLASTGEDASREQVAAPSKGLPLRRSRRNPSETSVMFNSPTEGNGLKLACPTVLNATKDGVEDGVDKLDGHVGLKKSKLRKGSATVATSAGEITSSGTASSIDIQIKVPAPVRRLTRKSVAQSFPEHGNSGMHEDVEKQKTAKKHVGRSTRRSVAPVILEKESKDLTKEANLEAHVKRPTRKSVVPVVLEKGGNSIITETIPEARVRRSSRKPALPMVNSENKDHCEVVSSENFQSNQSEELQKQPTVKQPVRRLTRKSAAPAMLDKDREGAPDMLNNENGDHTEMQSDKVGHLEKHPVVKEPVRRSTGNSVVPDLIEKENEGLHEKIESEVSVRTPGCKSVVPKDHNEFARMEELSVKTGSAHTSLQFSFQNDDSVRRTTRQSSKLVLSPPQSKPTASKGRPAKRRRTSLQESMLTEEQKEDHTNDVVEVATFTDLEIGVLPFAVEKSELLDSRLNSELVDMVVVEPGLSRDKDDSVILEFELQDTVGTTESPPSNLSIPDCKHEGALSEEAGHSIENDDGRHSPNFEQSPIGPQFLFSQEIAERSATHQAIPFSENGVEELDVHKVECRRESIVSSKSDSFQGSGENSVKAKESGGCMFSSQQNKEQEGVSVTSCPKELVASAHLDPSDDVNHVVSDGITKDVISKDEEKKDFILTLDINAPPEISPTDQLEIQQDIKDECNLHNGVIQGIHASGMSEGALVEVSKSGKMLLPDLETSAFQDEQLNPKRDGNEFEEHNFSFDKDGSVKNSTSQLGTDPCQEQEPRLPNDLSAVKSLKGSTTCQDNCVIGSGIGQTSGSIVKGHTIAMDAPVSAKQGDNMSQSGSALCMNREKTPASKTDALEPSSDHSFTMDLSTGATQSMSCRLSEAGLAVGNPDNKLLLEQVQQYEIQVLEGLIKSCHEQGQMACQQVLLEAANCMDFTNPEEVSYDEENNKSIHSTSISSSCEKIDAKGPVKHTSGLSDALWSSSLISSTDDTVDRFKSTDFLDEMTGYYSTEALQQGLKEQCEEPKENQVTCGADAGDMIEASTAKDLESGVPPLPAEETLEQLNNKMSGTEVVEFGLSCDKHGSKISEFESGVNSGKKILSDSSLPKDSSMDNYQQQELSEELSIEKSSEEPKENEVTYGAHPGYLIEAGTAKELESGVILLPAEETSNTRDEQLSTKLLSTEVVESSFSSDKYSSNILEFGSGVNNAKTILSDNSLLKDSSMDNYQQQDLSEKLSIEKSSEELKENQVIYGACPSIMIEVVSADDLETGLTPVPTEETSKMRDEQLNPKLSGIEFVESGLICDKDGNILEFGSGVTNILSDSSLPKDSSMDNCQQQELSEKLSTEKSCEESAICWEKSEPRKMPGTSENPSFNLDGEPECSLSDEVARCHVELQTEKKVDSEPDSQQGSHEDITTVEGIRDICSSQLGDEQHEQLIAPLLDPDTLALSDEQPNPELDSVEGSDMHGDLVIPSAENEDFNSCHVELQVEKMVSSEPESHQGSQEDLTIVEGIRDLFSTQLGDEQDEQLIAPQLDADTSALPDEQPMPNEQPNPELDSIEVSDMHDDHVIPSAENEDSHSCHVELQVEKMVDSEPESHQGSQEDLTIVEGLRDLFSTQLGNEQDEQLIASQLDADTSALPDEQPNPDLDSIEGSDMHDDHVIPSAENEDSHSCHVELQVEKMVDSETESHQGSQEDLTIVEGISDLFSSQRGDEQDEQLIAPQLDAGTSALLDEQPNPKLDSIQASDMHDDLVIPSAENEDSGTCHVELQVEKMVSSETESHQGSQEDLTIVEGFSDLFSLQLGDEQDEQLIALRLAADISALPDEQPNPELDGGEFEECNLSSDGTSGVFDTGYLKDNLFQLHENFHIDAVQGKELPDGLPAPEQSKIGQDESVLGSEEINTKFQYEKKKESNKHNDDQATPMLASQISEHALFGGSGNRMTKLPTTETSPLPDEQFDVEVVGEEFEKYTQSYNKDASCIFSSESAKNSLSYLDHKEEYNEQNDGQATPAIFIGGMSKLPPIGASDSGMVLPPVAETSAPTDEQLLEDDKEENLWFDTDTSNLSDTGLMDSRNLFSLPGDAHIDTCYEHELPISTPATKSVGESAAYADGSCPGSVEICQTSGRRRGIDEISKQLLGFKISSTVKASRIAMDSSNTKQGDNLGPICLLGNIEEAPAANADHPAELKTTDGL